VERGPRRPGGPEPRRLKKTPLPNIEWLLTQHGSITVQELQGLGCIAAAADQEGSYAMLVRRDHESIPELINRLETAIARAAENNVVVDDVNPPEGFKSTRNRPTVTNILPRSAYHQLKCMSDTAWYSVPPGQCRMHHLPISFTGRALPRFLVAPP
jgi:hypothetical protein